MSKILRFLLCLAFALQTVFHAAQAASVDAGAGSYTTVAPADRKVPVRTTFVTDAVSAPLPTNDWWSSLLWTKYSEAMFAHPLVVKCQAEGLRMAYPKVSTGEIGIFGGIPGQGDLVLGLEGVTFPDAQLDGYGDWFVSVRFVSDDRFLRVTFGHGSPFVFSAFDDASAPAIHFEKPPRIWSGGDGGAVVGLSVGDRHYGLFAPSGSSWQGRETENWVCRTPAKKKYFTVAVLPDASQATLDLFARHAHAQVVGTQVTWRYDEAASEVETQFTFETRPLEGGERGTLFALYPHQWSHLVKEPGTTLLPQTYESLRGPMKLASGTGFRTRLDFPGILPSLPPSGDKNILRSLLDEVAKEPLPPAKDTYWDGKMLGRIASLLPLARAVDGPAADALLASLKRRLEDWFTAGADETTTLFYYDEAWGTLIGYPASYGSDTDLSDHHFHYGYFLQAAGQVALADPAWASRWKPMADLLARDVAADRSDKQFPFLRNFDPYAGHSWASGTGKFADGNNQESSSEALNAWAGLILWGEATGDKALRDRGVFLYATELAAIENYWFDVENRNFPETFAAPYLTLLWGAKGVNETWFSRAPEAIHGINWLPVTGASLYLGRHPEYAGQRYARLVKEKGGENWSQWGDIIWMYRALSDPAAALKDYESRPEKFTPEDGNSLPNLYNWLHALNAFGQIEREIRGNYPLSAVFARNKVKTYVVYHVGPAARTVKFSDGTVVRCDKPGFAVVTK